MRRSLSGLGDIDHELRALDVMERANVMPFLGQSAKRIRRLYPRCELSHLDLVHDGLLAWAGARARGRGLEASHKYAENVMQVSAERDVMPLNGVGVEGRRLRIVGDVPAGYPDRPGDRFTRRLSRGDWRALKALFRRVLKPLHADILIRSVCRGESPDQIANDLGLTLSKLRSHRNRALDRVWTAVDLERVKINGRPRGVRQSRRTVRAARA